MSCAGEASPTCQPPELESVELSPDQSWLLSCLYDDADPRIAQLAPARRLQLVGPVLDQYVKSEEFQRTPKRQHASIRKITLDEVAMIGMVASGTRIEEVAAAFPKYAHNIRGHITLAISVRGFIRARLARGQDVLEPLIEALNTPQPPGDVQPEDQTVPPRQSQHDKQKPPRPAMHVRRDRYGIQIVTSGYYRITPLDDLGPVELDLLASIIQRVRPGREAANPKLHEDALCSQTDPDIFFPEKGESFWPAKRVCQNCWLQESCLEYALDHDECFGIWGGLTFLERRRLKRR